ncbi:MULTISPECIES: exonuclease domain-containing protein [Mycolicibacterium]|uniref:Exonuclease domain-containing protein n=1 Tax=Mycolicibacterium nivoides TaxID=2487344 RepID=A0ABW9LIM2_9MYCO|nr:exonuclease domain-containing protein [Mycolicibacterium fortuitum]UBV13103.1 exonuclease [Mycolicibacterium fortuitum]
MSDAGTGNLAVIDIETTGLDPRHDLILELGVVIIDNTLREVDHRSVLLATDSTTAWASRIQQRWNSFIMTTGAAAGSATTRRGDAGLTMAQAMHLDNGLIADLLNPCGFLAPTDLSNSNRVVSPSRRNGAREIRKFLDEHQITQPVPMVGSSVRSLDGPFLERHMPKLFSRFNHRTIDASALLELARFIDPDRHAALTNAVAPSMHRTVSDCRRSLDFIRAFAVQYGIGDLSSPEE